MEQETISYAELISSVEYLYCERNYTEALLDINDAIEMKGGDAWAYYLRAGIKNHLNQMNEAKDDWQRSIDLGGDAIKYFVKLTAIEKFRFE